MKTLLAASVLAFLAVSALPVVGGVHSAEAISGGTCTEDVNGDGFVDLTDALLVLAAFDSPGGTDVPEDLNTDGVVDSADLRAVIFIAGGCGQQPEDSRGCIGKQVGLDQIGQPPALTDTTAFATCP